jgi:hypothetical protein
MEMNLDGIARTSELLPDWRPSAGRPTFGFELPWWVADMPNYHSHASQFFVGESFERASNFFQVCGSLG